MLDLCARALDTLAKALSPGGGPTNESLEATMQLVSGDQSGSILELEGPLLSDSHVPFKVRQSENKNAFFLFIFFFTLGMGFIDMGW